MSPIIILIGIIVIAMSGFGISWRRRQLAMKNWSSREALDDDAVYLQFYAGSGLPRDEVLEVWHDVAKTLRVPAERLRPSDRFGKDIGTYWITSDDLDVLAAKGRKRAMELGLTIDLEKLSTVDEYVRCFAQPAATRTP